VNTLTVDEIVLAFELAFDRCAYCLDPLEGGGTVDHVIAMSDGGANSAENIVITCGVCNSMKGVHGPLFMLSVRRIIRAEDWQPGLVPWLGKS
jgi:5-methylcytosine-specific restriction endonuclease McrA